MAARFPQSPRIIKEMVCESRRQHYDRSSKMVQISNSGQPTETERTLGDICPIGQPSHSNASKGCGLMVLKLFFFSGLLQYQFSFRISLFQEYLQVQASISQRSFTCKSDTVYLYENYRLPLVKEVSLINLTLCIYMRINAKLS